MNINEIFFQVHMYVEPGHLSSCHPLPPPPPCCSFCFRASTRQPVQNGVALFVSCLGFWGGPELLFVCTCFNEIGTNGGLRVAWLSCWLFGYLLVYVNGELTYFPRRCNSNMPGVPLPTTGWLLESSQLTFGIHCDPLEFRLPGSQKPVFN